MKNFLRAVKAIEARTWWADIEDEVERLRNEEHKNDTERPHATQTAPGHINTWR